jgi:predicted nucleic acid-binding protein
LERLIADTGFLVALGRGTDPRHRGAREFSDRFEGQLVATSAVIVEACHFLTPGSRLDLLVSVGTRLAVVEVPVQSYADLAATIRKYADRDIDFADASLVWLAEQAGLRRILTVDVADFSTLRLKNGKRFDLVDWT